MAFGLTVLDYLVILGMLAISAGIGIFFAVKAGRRQSSKDYFLGNQKMGVIPVSFSLAATVMSAVTYLGTPAEIYMHGPRYGLSLICRIHTPLIVAILFVPVFYRLKVTTIYEYLGMRFNNTVRYTVVAIKCLYEFIYMGIVIYTPALALSLAANISLPFSILSVGLICTFYTSIGGIKAVIWTDVFQALSMVVGAGAMIIAGTAKIGGVAEGWRRAVEGGRGDLMELSPDPTVRFSLWSTVIGGTFAWLYMGASLQGLVQRYNSCRTEREAQIASWLGLIGMAIIEMLAIATGMTAYAYYYDCDPLTSGKMSRSDQIVPYFILDLFQSYRGVPGLMIGGAFCASLSSMSSVLNGIVAAVGQDIVKRMWPNLSDFRYGLTVKALSFAFGLVAIALAFLASVLGDVLKTAISIGGMVCGPVFGIYVLGMFVPRANSEGAMGGLIAGVTIGLVQYIGAQMYPSTREAPPLSVDGCLLDNMTTPAAMYTEVTTPQHSTMYDQLMGNISNQISSEIPATESPTFFAMSYLYLPAVTTTTCVVIGAIISYITSWRNPRNVDPRLLTPIVARYYRNAMNNDYELESYEKYDSVKQRQYPDIKNEV